MKIYSFYTKSHSALKDIFMSSLKDDYEVVIECLPKKTKTTLEIAGGMEIWRYKALKLIELMKENFGQTIIFADIDIKFYSKTEKLISTCMKEHDILFLDDRFKGGKANIGFMVIRCNEKTTKFFEKMLSIIENKKIWDQGAIWELLEGSVSQVNGDGFRSKGGLSWDHLPLVFLPWHRVSSGYTLCSRRRVSQILKLDLKKIVLCHTTGWAASSIPANKVKIYDLCEEAIKNPWQWKLKYAAKFFLRKMISYKRKRTFHYWNKTHRERILLSKPVTCDNSCELEVHIVTSEKDFLDAMWCLKTFYHYSGLRPRLVIHEDGTLSENGINFFLKHFINCRIIRRKSADKDLSCFLANYKYSQKNRMNKDFYCALKLFDIIYYASADKLLFLDSDILFFKKPNEMIKYIEEGTPFFSSDYVDAYAMSVSALNKITDIDILSKVNAGLMFFRKEFYVDNLNFIENYFKKMENLPQLSNINRHEQTINAILLSKCGAIRLNENYQISKKRITDKTICHHFVTDGSRNDFYTKGLKHLKSNEFLEE